MSLEFVGTFPVSGINIGLASALPALTAQIDLLARDSAQLAAAFSIQIGLLPDPVGLALSFALSLNPVTLGVTLAPPGWELASLTASVDLGLELAAIELQIALVTPIVDAMVVGLSASSLRGWLYSGHGFGAAMAVETASGFPGVSPTAPVSGFVVTTESLDSWESFGSGYRIGNTATDTGLLYVGALDGGYWSFGLGALKPRILGLLAELTGRRDALLVQIDITLGLGLPDVGAVVDAGLDVDLSAAIADMFSIQTDLTGSIGVLDSRIEAILELSGDISGSLSASGLSFYRYSGTATGLGECMAREFKGSASGKIYGTVLASDSPAEWDKFGRVFLT